MNEDNRPNPDALLNAIKEQTQKENSGQLRIFLGMSAGVGKTCAMLQAAHQKLKEGIDVAIGVVETHGRADTLELVKGLPIIPQKKFEYRGTLLEEMDLDAILKAKPKLVIVDELAHSNIPGSRHERRYLDVIEILEAGIDVYTAFNVQHLESRKDSVEAITGITIRETVPDSILERANLVELVDIAPSELLKRLKQGKVYPGEKAIQAEKNFFKEDKLTALREIALRMTAERVDQDLQKFISTKNDGSLWQTNERLLVAVSHSPYSEKLIRATRRLAYNLEAPWIALHVNTGITLNDADQSQLIKNLNLARELNAEVITTTDIDLPSAIKRVCRQKNVTQLIVGRPTRRWFRDVLERGNLLDQMVRNHLEVDIHIIRQEKLHQVRPDLIDEISYYHPKTSLIKYWYTFCYLIGMSMLGAILENFIGYKAVGFVFLLSVIIVGMFGSLGAVILAASMSTFIWDYFFIPPKMTYAINNSEDLLMCVSFFVVSLITGFLTQRIRFHEKTIREREERTQFLYEVLRSIANANEKTDFLNQVITKVGNHLEANCGIILKSTQGKLEFNEARIYSIRLNEKDQAVAQWCFKNKKIAGWSTDTLSQSRALFLPLSGVSETVGVFVFQPLKKSRKLDIEKENLLFSIVQQLGSSIERHFLNKRLAEAQRIKDSEELHQTLLNSISHEMRTPLTAILGTAAALENEDLIKNPNYIKEISVSLNDAGDRLNRVIENLLDMSRLNSGVLSLKLEWNDFNDLLNVVVKKLEKPLSQHQLKVTFLNELYLAKIDYTLMEHAIANILLNAAMYTPAKSEIKITLKKSSSHFIIEIMDNGPGIPEESMPKIFEKFYRAPDSPTGGTGLGLSIVKSIVELHKGSVKAFNVSSGVSHGACFVIELPLDIQPQAPGE
ncbi:MAG: sensor histidine kinase KdpD [Bdellovibrionaceae bacterium]|nr:sensor histidine kinase KdpD [Pseudobdellovibrionaceae bacterium]